MSVRIVALLRVTSTVERGKIKVLKRQVYGFRDLECFKLRLYFIHESTSAVPG